MCQRVESEAPGNGRIAALAAASVITSCAYLEGYINEFFGRFTTDGPLFEHLASSHPHLSKGDAEVLRAVWSPTVETLQPIEKYRLALALIRSKGFDEGRQPFQDVKLLFQLRNYLVHYKEGWKRTNKGRSLERDLCRILKVNETSAEDLYKLPPRIFPVTCLTSKAAGWAVESSFAFIQMFETKLAGTEP